MEEYSFETSKGALSIQLSQRAITFTSNNLNAILIRNGLAKEPLTKEDVFISEDDLKILNRLYSSNTYYITSFGEKRFLRIELYDNRGEEIYAEYYLFKK